MSLSSGKSGALSISLLHIRGVCGGGDYLEEGQPDGYDNV
jgi:hypothetical protein